MIWMALLRLIVMVIFVAAMTMMATMVMMTCLNMFLVLAVLAARLPLAHASRHGEPCFRCAAGVGTGAATGAGAAQRAGCSAAECTRGSLARRAGAGGGSGGRWRQAAQTSHGLTAARFCGQAACLSTQALFTVGPQLWAL